VEVSHLLVSLNQVIFPLNDRRILLPKKKRHACSDL
jgi:hypothetical protein